MKVIDGLTSPGFTRRPPPPPPRTDTCCSCQWSVHWIDSSCPSTVLNSVCPSCWAPGSKGGAPGPALTNHPGLWSSRARTPGSLGAHLTNCSLILSFFKKWRQKNIKVKMSSIPPYPQQLCAGASILVFCQNPPMKTQKCMRTLKV